jgi:hypothetical protein
MKPKTLVWFFDWKDRAKAASPWNRWHETHTDILYLAYRAGFKRGRQFGLDESVAHQGRRNG